MLLAQGIDHKPDQHADACSAEAVMPAQSRSQSAADEVTDEGTQVDAHVIDRVGTVAARIARRIQVTHLSRHVRLESAVTQDQKDERQKEGILKGHHEVPCGHQDAAQKHGFAAPKIAVSQIAAQDRGQIDETRVPAVQKRSIGTGSCIGAQSQPIPHRFPSPNQARVALHPRFAPLKDLATGHKQVVHQVKLQKTAHAVIGKTLPHLGEKEDSESFWVLPKNIPKTGFLRTHSGSRRRHAESPNSWLGESLQIFE